MNQHPPSLDLIAQLIAEARETLRLRRLADDERAGGGAAADMSPTLDVPANRSVSQRH